MKRLVVVGAGFAGMWSALAAARLRALETSCDEEIEILVVAPRAELVLRPRLYEAYPAAMRRQLRPLFDAVGVGFVAGRVESIDAARRELVILGDDPARGLNYDRLVLASGSACAMPVIDGLAEHAFSIDQLDEAIRFDAHLRGLALLPDTAARNTVVVVGGGFTGIEAAAELPARMRSILGKATPTRVVLIERADAIGPELGPGPRPVILEALHSQGVECLVGTSIVALDAGGLFTTADERIESLTVLWAGGMRASLLTAQLPGERDALGRLHAEADLRLPAARDVFVAGDTACASTDDARHHALMSCQHACVLGRFAGHNAAADLLGLDPLPYRQERYITCLDLGRWGAVVTRGWDRTVQTVGADAKATKRFINEVAIDPPPPVREEALAAADPMATAASGRRFA